LRGKLEFEAKGDRFDGVQQEDEGGGEPSGAVIAVGDFRPAAVIAGDKELHPRPAAASSLPEKRQVDLIFEIDHPIKLARSDHRRGALVVRQNLAFVVDPHWSGQHPVRIRVTLEIERPILSGISSSPAAVAGSVRLMRSSRVRRVFNGVAAGEKEEEE